MMGLRGRGSGAPNNGMTRLRGRGSEQGGYAAEGTGIYWGCHDSSSSTFRSPSAWPQAGVLAGVFGVSATAFGGIAFPEPAQPLRRRLVFLNHFASFSRPIVSSSEF